MSRTHRVLAFAVTAVIFALLARRIPLLRLLTALERADYSLFFTAMIPNTLFYVLWDTLVLTAVVRWFHGPVRYAELLPARAASYVVGFFNTNAGRGTLAVHLARRLGSPFLQLGSTVLFLVLTEYLHLVAWATIGILRSEATSRVSCSGDRPRSRSSGWRCSPTRGSARRRRHRGRRTAPEPAITPAAHRPGPTGMGAAADLQARAGAAVTRR